MARDPKYDVLFEPVRNRPEDDAQPLLPDPTLLGVRQRVPTHPGCLSRHEGRGGWGLVNTEYCSIHPESDDRPNIQARLWDETDVRNLSLMCDRVHEHDSLAGVELNFQRASAHRLRDAPAGTRRIANTHPSVGWRSVSCYEMDKHDIRELQGFYVDAAKRGATRASILILVYGAERSVSRTSS